MTAIIVILLLALLSVSIWNFKTLNDIKKLGKENRTLSPDAKYFELKYNIQFLVGLSTILIAVLGVLGYRSLDDVKSQLSDNLATISTTIEEKENTTKELDFKITKIAESANAIDLAFNQVKVLESKVKEINSKNILTQNYYIVSPLKIELTMGVEKIIYFKDLMTNTGDRLPVFKFPPLVFGTLNSNTSFMIYSITTSSFKIASSTILVAEGTPTEIFIKPELGLMIIEK